MNYKIINDLEILQSFIDNVLPRLETSECFYACLFARSKYVRGTSDAFPHIKTDKAQLKRFTISKKHDLIDKLRQLEVAIGSFKTKDGDNIPQESLACYISLNPRSQKKATYALMNRALRLLETNAEGYNIHQEAMSAIQQSKSYTKYIVFDIDSKEESDINLIKPFINQDACMWLETRGGYHLIINPDKVDEKFRRTYYKYITFFKFVDSAAGNDIMIPIPGTYQGGFTPHFVNNPIL